jgi:LacI family transcriptional regulator
MPKYQRTTILDVARAAGVSMSTVSRVLNDTAHVEPDKRTAVLAAIQDLKYQPDLAAQGLARGTSMTVGVLTQDIASPFYGGILSGVEQGLRESNFSPIFVSGHWQLEDELVALGVLLRRRLDGVIIVGGQIPDDRLRHVAQQTPLVAVGRSIVGLEDHCVQVENYQGSYEATRHLIDLGHLHIAHIMGIPSHPDAIDRLKGFRQALCDAGLEVTPDLIVEGHFNEHGGRLAVETLLMRRVLFTAIVAANDQMAYGARLGLFEHHLRVPEDISLVGFDDQTFSPYSIPPLTTIRQPTVEMGAVAARAILRMIDGHPPQLEKSVLTELIPRKSTALRR